MLRLDVTVADEPAVHVVDSPAQGRIGWASKALHHSGSEERTPPPAGPRWLFPEVNNPPFEMLSWSCCRGSPKRTTHESH